jgi:tetratricopeptide (TPR) repeat protein
MAADEKDAEVWYNIGLVYLELGKYIETITSYDHCIQLNPQMAWAFYNRACAYSSLKKKNEAIGDLKQAFLLNPDNVLSSAKIDPKLNNIRNLPEFDKIFP